MNYLKRLLLVIVHYIALLMVVSGMAIVGTAIYLQSTEKNENDELQKEIKTLKTTGGVLLGVGLLAEIIYEIIVKTYFPDTFFAVDLLEGERRPLLQQPVVPMPGFQNILAQFRPLAAAPAA